ncbi:MAG: TetR/AcrR family transcriptional regulator [Symploca sp. SIO2C1]|nr:TetR/AcrR family transcriptional regulator [Symploca sp. SIO2C1]
MSEQSDTAQKILSVAQRLVQERGYNAFSYGDIAEELGIRRAAIHYHFPCKNDLGRGLVVRYREACRQLLQQIDLETEDPQDKLRRYIQTHREMLQDGQMCLCGMLAAEVTTLSDAIAAEVKAFFSEHEMWVTQVLLRGRKLGVFDYKGQPEATARMLLSSLEGAMLIARSQGDLNQFHCVAQELLAGLGIKT